MRPAKQFIRLFDYDSWANKQVLISLRDHLHFENSDKAIRYFAHLAGAQDLWYRRIQDESLEDLKVWPDYGLSEALHMLKTYSSKWKDLIETSHENLDHIIAYENSKGTPYETMLSDILHHVIIHGQHHRAQIAKLLRNAKIEPPATDFIFFSRTM